MPLNSFRNVFADYLKTWKSQAESHCEEMMTYKSTLHSLKAEISHNEVLSISISSEQKCEICGQRAASEICYVFPCRHCFHEACLRAIVLPTLDAERSERLFSLE